MALMAAGAMSPAQAFPELAPASEDDEEDDGFAKDTEEVTYIFPDEPLDPQSIEQELRELAASAAKGTSTFEAPAYSDWI